MTAKRKDGHSTEFGLWLREQQEIDSKKGFVATNIDYIWHNYKTGDWMIIEEKRYNSSVKRWQKSMFDIVDWCARISGHRKYKGFHIIRFEKTNPDDGRIYIDGKERTRQELIKFLMFEALS